ncbi:MAG: chromate transporter, chromate ion transporter family, partial [Sporomusa sp.]|nr:chromate transporter, chromate ion transporter family [Sporomusa sp.]
MDTTKRKFTVESANGVIPLSGLFLTYIIIGSIGYGPTLAAETQKRLVQKKQWITEEDFINGLSLAQLLPGATYINLTVYIGYKLRGISGALTAFFALLLTPFAAVLTLSHIYFTYHSIETVSVLFKGVAVVIVGVIAQAVIIVGRSTVLDMWAGIIALAAAGLMLWSGSPFVVLLAAALAGIVAYYRSLQSSAEVSGDVRGDVRGDAPKNLRWFAAQVWPALALGIISAIILYAAPIPPILMQLGEVFFRLGAVLFGGGL